MGCQQSKGKSADSIPRRIMLIGKTGTGKSTLGNAILGKPTFNTEGHSMVSTSFSCDTGRATIYDKEIVILDTPGVMGTNQDEEHIMKEIFNGAMSLQPGPHVFLLVIKADAKFTKEEIEAVEIFGDVFGEAMYNYLIIVFTQKSALDKRNKTEEDCIWKLPETFQQFKKRCIAIETGGKSKQVKKGVKKLLQVVEKVVQNNKGGFYPNEKIKEMEMKYMARIKANRGFRAKSKEKVQELVGVVFDKVADAAEDVKEKVTGQVTNVLETVHALMH